MKSHLSLFNHPPRGVRSTFTPPTSQLLSCLFGVSRAHTMFYFKIIAECGTLMLFQRMYVWLLFLGLHYWFWSLVANVLPSCRLIWLYYPVCIGNLDVNMPLRRASNGNYSVAGLSLEHHHHHNITAQYSAVAVQYTYISPFKTNVGPCTS